MVANGTYLRQSGLWVSGRRSIIDAISDGFIYNVTKPQIVNPDSPTASDNVGWDGTVDRVEVGSSKTYIIPSNTTVSNIDFQCFVGFTDSTSRAVNCRMQGGVAGGTYRNGTVFGSNGGQLYRCTIRPNANTARWDMNGVSSTGGNWLADRCSFSRAVDGVHANNSGFWTIMGSHFDNYSFWNTDTDHSSDGPHPNWSHGDCFQRLSGTGGDQITGSVLNGFFDRTGVTGNAVGSYAGGLIGTPAVAMNSDGQGTYGSTSYPDGNYGNLLSWTNAYNYNGIYVGFNWLNGGNYPSALIQLPTTGGATNSLKVEGNRISLDGKRSPAGKIFIATGTATTWDWSGADNVYGVSSAAGAPAAGGLITTSSTGASVTF